MGNCTQCAKQTKLAGKSTRHVRNQSTEVPASQESGQNTHNFGHPLEHNTHDRTPLSVNQFSIVEELGRDFTEVSIIDRPNRLPQRKISYEQAAKQKINREYKLYTTENIIFFPFFTNMLDDN